MSNSAEIVGALRVLNQAALTFDQLKTLFGRDDITEAEVDAILNAVDDELDQSARRLSEDDYL